MRSTEIVNARLLSVRGGTGGDDWEGPAAEGPVKWLEPGGVGAYFEERPQRTVGQGGARVVAVWRLLQVREELGVDWQVGDAVSFQPEDLDAPLDGTVQAVEDPHTGKGSAGEVTLTLEIT